MLLLRKGTPTLDFAFSTVAWASYPSTTMLGSRSSLILQNAACAIFELSPCVSDYGKTAHLHRRIPEHRAAGLGLYGRAARGQVRSFVCRAVAVRRRPARGPRRRGHHSFDRVSAHGKRGGAAGNGGRGQERSAQPAGHLESAHRAGSQLRVWTPIRAARSGWCGCSAAALEHRAGIHRLGARSRKNAGPRGCRADHRRSGAGAAAEVDALTAKVPQATAAAAATETSSPSRMSRRCLSTMSRSSGAK